MIKCIHIVIGTKQCVYRAALCSYPKNVEPVLFLKRHYYNYISEKITHLLERFYSKLLYL